MKRILLCLAAAGMLFSGAAMAAPKKKALCRVARPACVTAYNECKKQVKKGEKTKAQCRDGWRACCGFKKKAKKKGG
jgi:hypothetical protein